MIKCNRLMLAGFCFLFAAATRLPAQGNTAEVFGGYSYAQANPEAPLPKQNMNGWMGGASGYMNQCVMYPEAPPLPKQNMNGWMGGASGYMTHWFGASVEIAAGFGSIAAPSGIGGTALNFKEYKIGRASCRE